MQSAEPEYTHQTVLLNETVEIASSGVGQVAIDCTLGLGGHSEALLEATNFDVIGLDRDAKAIELASKRLQRFGRRFRAIHSNFVEIANLEIEGAVAAIIADLGVSSMQLDDPSRGFSFREDAPLDMRMDASSGRTAAELLAELSESEIADLIYQFGEERKSRRIARLIVESRERGKPVQTTRELALLVERAVGRGTGRIHPATRTFQALRIAVNRELEILDRFIRSAVSVLNKRGVLAMITFHSLEDRIVKRAFQRLSGKCICPPRMPQCICGAERKVELITRKPIIPTAEELNKNPRSRSAKLRACRKI